MTETDSSARTYSFVLTTRGAVSVSLTGMNRDIDCSVDGSPCSNRGGTADDDWSGELDAGTHTVRVYPYRGGWGNWTLTVTGPSSDAAPTVHTLPFTVSETGVSGSRTYTFRLPSSSEVNVSLTGLDRDVDCRVNDSKCTNHGGTRDDSWSGTLGAGTHVVTVYPYGGGSGSWTLAVTAPGAVEPPPSAPTGVQRTVETRVGLAYSTETNSFGQTYTFTLASRQTVNVSLTGMDRDIDCSVNGSRCSNRSGTSADDWSGELGPGTHTVRVYPYHGGTGAWTITASVNCPAGHFASGGSCHRYVVPERPIDGPIPMTGEGPEVLSCDDSTELGGSGMRGRLRCLQGRHHGYLHADTHPAHCDHRDRHPTAAATATTAHAVLRFRFWGRRRDI